MCLLTQSFSRLAPELPGSGGDEWMVEEEEVGRRRDLRDTHLIFSIDPQGCEDVDDTLSIRLGETCGCLFPLPLIRESSLTPSLPLSSPSRHLKRGITELGVHIADVSHFVQPDSLTDRKARQRSTTVYLADRRYDMLPRVLNADLCSLLSNVDRYSNILHGGILFPQHLYFLYTLSYTSIYTYSCRYNSKNQVLVCNLNFLFRGVQVCGECGMEVGCRVSGEGCVVWPYCDKVKVQADVRGGTAAV